MKSWQDLNQQITNCRKCPRLVTYCQNVAREKKRAFANQEYWGKPVPNFGDALGRLLIVGLAPAAHGANRTGRMFTGDRSGEWLYRALHRAGLSNKPLPDDVKDHRADDGLELKDCAITAACHCAPPQNKPTKEELAVCFDWLKQTVAIMPVQGFIALGLIGWQAVVQFAREIGIHQGPIPKFHHLAMHRFNNGFWMLGSYHPSQQNTFTGKLTEPMFDAAFSKAKELLSAPE
jgi:uracil-DNA glycosylase family 4